MNDLITRELDQGLLTLAFNRPDKLNALNTAMYQQLGDLLLAAGEDPGVDAIIITGGAHCFTAGNDLRDFLDTPPTDLDSPVFRLDAGGHGAGQAADRGSQWRSNRHRRHLAAAL